MRKTALKEALIPIPYPDNPLKSLQEQRRIVARIEALTAEVREMRQLQERITADTTILGTSLLAETVETLNDQYPQISLGDLIDSGDLQLMGGGTPSKQKPEYWTGDIPWVSPKDMKVWLISDSQDHITEEAIRNSSTKRIPIGSVLFVVRGMILAKTWPVAVTQRQVTINQDMKAIVFLSQRVNCEYLGYMLRALTPQLLRRIETSAHGTKRLKTETIRALEIPFAPIEEQMQIVAYLDSALQEIDGMLALQEKDRQLISTLESAVLAQAFRGEL